MLQWSGAGAQLLLFVYAAKAKLLGVEESGAVVGQASRGG